MATTSSFGDRRSRVSFDRVELDDSPLGDRAFELSNGVELVGEEVKSVTWIYDIVKDHVTWSSPIEEFFGFEVGVRGFSVLRDDVPALPAARAPPSRERRRGRPDGTEADGGRRDDDANKDETDSSGDTGSAATGDGTADDAGDDDLTFTGTEFADGIDTGEALLAPILAPIRLGCPPAEFDLHVSVRCPDGIVHNVVVRASPTPALAPSDSSPKTPTLTTSASSST